MHVRRPDPSALSSVPSGIAKDESAFWREATEVAKRKASRLFRGPKRDLIDDIAQEALELLHERRMSIQGDWRAYLGTIVLNLARAHFRREKMRIADEAPNSPMIEEGQCRRVDQPHEAAIEREIRQLLPELLHRLDAEFGRGTRTIVEFRNQGVAWAR